MQIHDYLRPLWHNGPHVVHDAPARVRTAFDLLFARGGPRPAGRGDAGGGEPAPGAGGREPTGETRRGRGHDLVQIHRVRPLDMTVAWLQAEIELPVAGTGFSYRRARYLHAIAVEGAPGRALSVRHARELFEAVYGSDLIAGITEAQRWLHGLEHPDGAEEARRLFVGAVGELRPATAAARAEGRADASVAESAPSRAGQPPALGPRDIGQVALAEVESRPGAWLTAPGDLPPVTAPAASPQPAPPAAGDASARSEADSSAPATARSSAAPPEASPATDSASLSALLHGRLSAGWPREPETDPDAETAPLLKAPRREPAPAGR